MDKNVILAKKYGGAIYEIAEEHNILEQVEGDLNTIVETVGSHKELSDLLNHPLLAKNVKKDTIQRLFADKVHPIVLQYVYVMIDKGRFSVFPEAAKAFVSFAHRRMGVEEAVVVSALPLTEEQADALKSAIAKITGSQIIMKRKVDASLLGGVTVEVGARLIDGSVAGRLRTLKADMMRGD